MNSSTLRKRSRRDSKEGISAAMNSTNESQVASRNFYIGLIVIDSLLVICGVLGNVVVIVYNLFLNPIKNATCYFVLNLAISDLLVCGIYFPTYITECVRILVGTATGQDIVCQISLTVTGVSLALSVMNLMMLTVDRYISITRPLKYPNIVTTQRTCIALALVWSAGFLNGVLIFSSTKSTGVPMVCEVDMAVALTGSIVCFYIPLTATVVFNVKILKIARVQRRKIAVQVVPSEVSTSGSGTSRRHFARQLKLFKTFALVFGCFIFCVTPFPVIAVIGILVCSGGCIPIEVIIVSAVLAGSNSVLNAFIYGVRHEEYRRAFRVLLSQPCKAF